MTDGASAKLLAHPRMLYQIQAHASEVFGKLRRPAAELLDTQARFAKPWQGLAERAEPCQLDLHRIDGFLHEPPDGREDRLHLFGHREIHGCAPELAGYCCQAVWGEGRG